MSVPRYDEAIAAIVAQLRTDFPGATVLDYPVEIEPEVLFGDSASWPSVDVPCIAVFDSGQIVKPPPDNRGPADSVQQAFQTGRADVVAWVKGGDFATVGQAVRETRRAVMESVQRVDVAHAWSSFRWSVEWDSADVRITRTNVGLYISPRVGISILFDE